MFDMTGGGAERVLVNLFHELPPESYDITLFSLFGTGANMGNIPPHIKVKCLFKKQFRGLTTFMKLFPPKLLYHFFIRDTYDIQIAYMENSATRIIAGAPDTIKKVAWVHSRERSKTSYTMSFRNYSEMIRCYQQYNRIVFVAQDIMDRFKAYHPEINVPMQVIYNVNPEKKIQALGKEPIDFGLSSNMINVCTVGRLTPVKGFERLLQIVHKLNVEGYHNRFNLYILGEGKQKELLQHLINKHQLTNVHLLGYHKNPYRYVAKMDLFICSSYEEGYSTAASEALLLGLPVLTTSVSGMEEMLQHGKYGMIVENELEALYSGFKTLLDNPNQIEEYKNHIIREVKGVGAKAYEELFNAL